MASVRRIADKVAMVHNGVIICHQQNNEEWRAEVHQFVHGLAEGPLTNDWANDLAGS